MVNTRKRFAAMRQAAAARYDAQPARAVNVIAPGRDGKHALVDEELNQRLAEYEKRVRARFSAIEPVLRQISAMQHAEDFVWRAQEFARERLGYELPGKLLENAWITGLDMGALNAACIFRSFAQSVELAGQDQAPWRERIALSAEFLLSCGYHTVDISPCADGRLQGLLSFILRMVPGENVMVKAYAGALFDVEGDVADWTQRELDRLTGGIPGGETANYLKIAVYHYSASEPGHQGCAAHGSNDQRAVEAALARLGELRAAIENTFGRGAAPDILLIGVNTDLDTIRVHLPDANGEVNPYRFVDTVELYQATLGMDAQAARAHIAQAVARTERADGWAQGEGEMSAGMRALVLKLLEANLSQIEFVIRHHDGRYAVLGHDEAFICAGEAPSYVHLRNKYYYAHLDTVEEGAADMDVGINIFTGLNVRRGLAIPVLVHYHYSSRVPGGRERAVARCRRVKAAIESRYADLFGSGLLHCQMAVSDRYGSERCAFVDDQDDGAGH